MYCTNTGPTFGRKMLFQAVFARKCIHRDRGLIFWGLSWQLHSPSLCFLTWHWRPQKPCKKIFHITNFSFYAADGNCNLYNPYLISIDDRSITQCYHLHAVLLMSAHLKPMVSFWRLRKKNVELWMLYCIAMCFALCKKKKNNPQNLLLVGRFNILLFVTFAYL